jgi:predicted MPP superfamily phosphohydrolase
MKGYQFVMFLTIFFTIFLTGNTYVFIRGWQALPANIGVRAVYSILFSLAAFSFIAGEFFRRKGFVENDKIIILIGSIWLAFILYAILIIIVIDLVRGLNYFFHFLPAKEVLLKANVPLMFFIGTVFVSFSIVVIGIIIAASPVVKKVDIKIDKKANNKNSLNIVMASDIHLGSIIGKKRFHSLADTINSLNPDLVLFTGDFIDRTLEPFMKDDIGTLIESIRSKYGLYAVAGNHEYFEGISRIVNFMNEHKINILLDESVEIDRSFLLVGREDRHKNRFSDRKTERKTLPELLAGKRTELPIIVMDHQPSSLEESVKNKIDLQLSGHTHNGQLWPINHITNAIYEVSNGYAKIEDTHIYVSKGYGTWGPPVRTTGRPEIVVLSITFIEIKPLRP